MKRFKVSVHCEKWNVLRSEIIIEEQDENSAWLEAYKISDEVLSKLDYKMEGNTTDYYIYSVQEMEEDCDPRQLSWDF